MCTNKSPDRSFDYTNENNIKKTINKIIYDEKFKVYYSKTSAVNSSSDSKRIIHLHFASEK